LKIEDQLTAELILTVAWLEDTLQPAIDILKVKSIAEDIRSDILIFEEKKGQTDQSKKGLDRINQMIECIERLDKISSQNNTFKLVAKHAELKNAKLENENTSLKLELESVKKAWEQL